MADIKKIKLGNTTYDIVDGVHKNVIILEDNGSATAGTWLAKTDRISAYADGQVFLYKVPIAGVSDGTTLNINSLGAKNIYRGASTKLTTHYGVGSYVLLYYSASLNSGSFMLVNDYATDNDKKTASANTSKKIYLIGATSQSSSGQTTYSHDTVYVDTDGHLYCNGKKVSHVGHTHEITTANVAPQGHTHNVTVSGTTGANSGTAISAATAIGVKSSSSAAPGGHTHNYEKPTGVTLTANSSTATGRITYVQSISSTGASASSTAKVGSETHTHSYDKTIDILLTPNLETDAGRIQYVESISGSKPTLGGTKTFVTGVSGGSGSLTSDTTATNGIKYVESISGGSGSLVAYNAATDGAVTVENGNRIPVVTLVGHTAASVKSTANAAPHTHTHTYTKPTGISLGSNTTATNGIKYLEDVSHTAASLTGTKTFNTDAIKSVTLSASDTSTDGPVYVQSISGSAPSLGGTKTFVTSVTTGSGSLTAYDAATGGTEKVANGTRIPVITSLSKSGYTPAGSVTLNNGTAPSMGSATTKYLSASASGTAVGANGTGSVAPSGHTHTVTVSGTTGASSGTAVKAVTGYSSFSGGSLGGTTTFNTDAIKSVGGTKNYGFSSSTTNIMRAPSVSEGVLKWSTASASTQDAHTGTAASTGTVSFTAASLGTASTADVAPASHTHSYGNSSTALTTSGNSGTAVTALTGVKVTTQPTITLTANTSTATGRIKYVEAQGSFSAGTTPKASATFTGTNSTAVVTGGTTYYLNHAHTSAKSGGTGTVTISGGSYSATPKYMKATTEAASTGTVGISGGSVSKTTKYFHPSITTDTAAATGNNSGSAVAAVTAINGGSISPTTYYIAHNHTGAGSTTKYLHHTHTGASSSGTGTVSISGGEYTAATRYLSAAPYTTATASDTPSATTTVVTGVSGGTTSATTKYLSAAPTTTTTATTANSGTNFNAATAVEITSTGSAAPSGHTHSYGSSTALTTTGNSGTAVEAVVDVAASTD